MKTISMVGKLQDRIKYLEHMTDRLRTSLGDFLIYAEHNEVPPYDWEPFKVFWRSAVQNHNESIAEFEKRADKSDLRRFTEIPPRD